MSRRIERALACLAAVVFLAHARAAGESASAPVQQSPPSSSSPGEHHETLIVAGSAVELTIRAGSSPEASTRIIALARRAWPRIAGWLGPIADGTITIADAPWTPDAMCVASPGLATVSSRWIQPEHDRSLERAVIAALVRQPLFAIGLGSDDGFVEGLARFVTVRAINETLEGDHLLTERFFGGFVPHTIRALPLSRRAADPRPLATRFDSRSASLPCAPALVPGVDEHATDVMVAMLSLERSIGWAATQSAVATLIERAGGRTAAPADLVAILTEQQGSAPAPILVAALSRALRIDAGIAAFESSPQASDGAYRTTLRLRQTSRPEMEWPAALQVLFADRRVVREYVTVPRDGVVLEYDSASPATSAAIDPDRTLLFDANRADNARATAPELPQAGLRRLLNWLVWLQDAALTGSALV